MFLGVLFASFYFGFAIYPAIPEKEYWVLWVPCHTGFVLFESDNATNHGFKWWLVLNDGAESDF